MNASMHSNEAIEFKPILRSGGINAVIRRTDSGSSINSLNNNSKIKRRVCFKETADVFEDGYEVGQTILNDDHSRFSALRSPLRKLSNFLNKKTSLNNSHSYHQCVSSPEESDDGDNLFILDNIQSDIPIIMLKKNISTSSSRNLIAPLATMDDMELFDSFEDSDESSINDWIDDVNEDVINNNNDLNDSASDEKSNCVREEISVDESLDLNGNDNATVSSTGFNKNNYNSEDGNDGDDEDEGSNCLIDDEFDTNDGSFLRTDVVKITGQNFQFVTDSTIEIINDDSSPTNDDDDDDGGGDDNKEIGLHEICSNNDEDVQDENRGKTMVGVEDVNDKLEKETLHESETKKSGISNNDIINIMGGKNELLCCHSENNYSNNSNNNINKIDNNSTYNNPLDYWSNYKKEFDNVNENRSHNEEYNYINYNSNNYESLNNKGNDSSSDLGKVMNKILSSSNSNDSGLFEYDGRSMVCSESLNNDNVAFVGGVGDDKHGVVQCNDKVDDEANDDDVNDATDMNVSYDVCDRADNKMNEGDDDLNVENNDDVVGGDDVGNDDNNDEFANDDGSYVVSDICHKIKNVTLHSKSYHMNDRFCVRGDDDLRSNFSNRDVYAINSNNNNNNNKYNYNNNNDLIDSQMYTDDNDEKLVPLFCNNNNNNDNNNNGNNNDYNNSINFNLRENIVNTDGDDEDIRCEKCDINDNVDDNRDIKNDINNSPITSNKEGDDTEMAMTMMMTKTITSSLLSPTSSSTNDSGIFLPDLSESLTESRCDQVTKASNTFNDAHNSADNVVAVSNVQCNDGATNNQRDHCLDFDVTALKEPQKVASHQQMQHQQNTELIQNPQYRQQLYFQQFLPEQQDKLQLQNSPVHHCQQLLQHKQLQHQSLQQQHELQQQPLQQHPWQDNPHLSFTIKLKPILKWQFIEG
ncbi:hypothetical protein HELRODRAFT_159579 [Helobdella robusta]|uniref:Uncharacterized protein n=1 Tax=Helobdella robusta TaxID=6412 RepID=T1EP67_HELRO|nr:hypothetical protein HELRODRAFT_159579 [Helobdella robusta]ESO12985.1 hypothetical protein HELRODRAFT_159579 [Helobdella robusta]